MKPRGLGGSGNKPEILAMANHVNSLEQAQAEWKMVENIQTGKLKAILVEMNGSLKLFENSIFPPTHRQQVTVKNLHLDDD